MDIPAGAAFCLGGVFVRSASSTSGESLLTGSGTAAGAGAACGGGGAARLGGMVPPPVASAMKGSSSGGGVDEEGAAGAGAGGCCAGSAKGSADAGAGAALAASNDTASSPSPSMSKGSTAPVPPPAEFDTTAPVGGAPPLAGAAAGSASPPTSPACRASITSACSCWQLPMPSYASSACAMSASASGDSTDASAASSGSNIAEKVSISPMRSWTSASSKSPLPSPSSSSCSSSTCPVAIWMQLVVSAASACQDPLPCCPLWWAICACCMARCICAAPPMPATERSASCPSGPLSRSSAKAACLALRMQELTGSPEGDTALVEGLVATSPTSRSTSLRASDGSCSRHSRSTAATSGMASHCLCALSICRRRFSTGIRSFWRATGSLDCTASTKAAISSGSGSGSVLAVALRARSSRLSPSRVLL
mmetsp:Transcript_37717/g.97881  ORF Transcript_37717/g.97881 Transcript_37717/m.97881 type:complete len:424 (+) Transcript_37717:146-1417(+)